jgi:hypothetical protein
MHDTYSLDERKGYMDGYQDASNGLVARPALSASGEGQPLRDYTQGYWEGHCAGSESKALRDFHVGPLFAEKA